MSASRPRAIMTEAARRKLKALPERLRTLFADLPATQAQASLSKGGKAMPRDMRAVMADRHDRTDAIGDFPTPPWATRALIEHVLIGALGYRGRRSLNRRSVWECAANRRYMARVLLEYFGRVHESDLVDYGAGVATFDFLELLDPAAPLPSFLGEQPDFVLTNPPFTHLGAFIRIAARVARRGFALFCQLRALETIDRYRLYSELGGHLLWAQHVERVALVKGRYDPHAGTATAYGWLVYDRAGIQRPFAADAIECMPLVFIPPCRAAFERDGDEQLPGPAP